MPRGKGGREEFILKQVSIAVYTFVLCPYFVHLEQIKLKFVEIRNHIEVEIFKPVATQALSRNEDYV